MISMGRRKVKCFSASITTSYTNTMRGIVARNLFHIKVLYLLLKENMMRILYVNNMNQLAKSYGEDMAQRGHTVKVYQPSLAGAAAPLPIKLAMLPGRIYEM